VLTKIDCCNIIQIELASGKVSADLWQKYPIPVISRILNVVLDEICMKNPAVRNAMAIPRELTYALSGNYYVASLSPMPLSGVYGFAYIYDDKVKQYSLRTPSLNGVLAVLNPSGGDFAVLELNNRLKFSQKPVGTLIASYIPNVQEMEDSDLLLLPGSESYLIQATLNIFRSRKDQVQEILNDSKVDAG
jgi:hypothetical protein